MDSIFVNAVNRANIQAVQFGGTAVSGAQAVENSKAKTAPRNIGNSMFADGDVVEIPALPVAGNPQESDAQWLEKPLSRGGDPVQSVLCKVTTKSGAVVCKELFAGTLVKSAIENGTEVTYSTTGTVPNAVDGLASLYDVFAAVAGKKIKFSNPKTFKTVRRDFTGQRPDRIANTTVFQIDFA